ncbi:MAG: hypothetical protein SPJ28_01255 [Oscillospiraceae bacterium]|nr:hypothetical protein [Oscillospiraceae bacterium]
MTKLLSGAELEHRSGSHPDTGITNRFYFQIKVKVGIIVIAIHDVANGLHPLPAPFLKNDVVNITHIKMTVNVIFIQKMRAQRRDGRSQR